MSGVVVLLGPPASGKTTIGAAMVAHGYRFREWEVAILERWGTREQFVANKVEALPALQRDIRTWIGAAGGPAVIESTGLSDGAFLDALTREMRAFVARIDVSAAEAERRLRCRPTGRHLTDDLDGNARVRREYERIVLPRRRVDLVIDGDRLSAVEAAALIARAAG